MIIAIKLPDKLSDRIHSFVCLHALFKFLKNQVETNNMDKDEEEKEALFIHLICFEQDIEVLNLLPFNAYYHELESEDVKSIFSIHRSCMNMKIDKVDLFMSMTESFVDASIAKNLSAKKSIGFNITKNNFFLSNKVSALKGRKRAEYYFELLKPIMQDDFPEEFKKVSSKNLETYYNDWSENPYVIVDLSCQEDELDQSLIDLFNLSEGVNFVLTSWELTEDSYLRKLEDLIRNLSNKNNYKVFDSRSLISLARALSFADTFISFNSSLMSLAGYVGAHAHFLALKDESAIYGFDYFYSNIRTFNLNEPQYQDSGGVKINLVIDEVINYINRKKESRE